MIINVYGTIITKVVYANLERVPMGTVVIYYDTTTGYLHDIKGRILPFEWNRTKESFKSIIEFKECPKLIKLCIGDFS